MYLYHKYDYNSEETQNIVYCIIPLTEIVLTVSNSKSSEINKVIRSKRVYLYTERRVEVVVWTLCDQYLGTLNQTWVTKLPHLYLNCKLLVPSSPPPLVNHTKPLPVVYIYTSTTTHHQLGSIYHIRLLFKRKVLTF